jgi:hypothetical protein
MEGKKSNVADPVCFSPFMNSSDKYKLLSTYLYQILVNCYYHTGIILMTIGHIKRIVKKGNIYIEKAC